MKRKKCLQLLITMFYLLLGNKTWGQTTEIQNNKHNLIIKSPDANQLSKHIDIPNSTYTGTIGIHIPIYTINIDGYTLPIELKYHASGVKVKETASKVGLGWSLSIGGISLSKQIMGNQDIGYPKYINPNQNLFLPNNNSEDNHLAQTVIGYNNPLGQKFDNQPDIFDYSIIGQSGKYYLDTSNKVVKIPETSVKIKSNFELIDDNGNIYYFTEANKIQNTGGDDSSLDTSNQNTTDYKISKIVLNSGKEINFDYGIISYNYYSNLYKEIKRCVECASGASDQNSELEYYTTTRVIYENILNKITFEEGSIEFNYGNRLDLQNSKKVESIISKDKNGQIISNHSLSYSYFTTNDDANTFQFYINKEGLQKRLRLDSITNVLDNSKHSFNYNEQYPLPNRLSQATDYLGFYNGKVENKGIPYTFDGPYFYGDGDNKNPNIVYAISGTLKQITYPTSGKMELEYELDDFDFDDIEEEMTSNAIQAYSDGLINTFQVNSQAAAGTLLKIKFQSTANPSDDGSGSLPVGAHFIGQLMDSNNSVIRTFLVNKEYEFLVNQNAAYKIRIIRSGNLNVNDYATLDVKWFNFTYNHKKYNKSIGGLRVKSLKKIESNNTIKKTEFLYRDENNVSTGIYIGDPIKYSYTQESPCRDTFQIIYDCTNKYLVINNSGNFNISTVNGKPTAYNRVTSKFINTKNNTENYILVDKYHNAPMTNTPSFKSPMFTFDGDQYARGLLLSKEYYDSNNMILNKIENIYDFDYHYNQFSNDYFVGNHNRVTMKPYYLWVKSIVLQKLVGLSFVAIPIFDYDRYEITSAWVKNKLTKVTNYLNGQELKETTDYFYDNTYKHLNPLIQTTTFPDNSVQETSYQYAHEKGNQYLIDKNMVGIPLQTTVAKTSNGVTKTLSDVETKYPASQTEADSKTTGLALPYEAWSKDFQGNTSKEVLYKNYDDKGNLREYIIKPDTNGNGTPVTLIWGYNNTQPIAKIEGATYGQVQNEITDIVLASEKDNNPAAYSMSSDEAEINLRNKLDEFRKKTNLSNYQITTYTYDPLIGVTSITPPSGIREIYQYDSANRLEKVVDVNGNILKEYQYNYKQ